MATAVAATTAVAPMAELPAVDASAVSRGVGVVMLAPTTAGVLAVTPAAEAAMETEAAAMEAAEAAVACPPEAQEGT